MEIEYKGANCVVLKTKSDIVVVDPTTNVGVKDFGTGSVVLWTDDSFKLGTDQSGFIIDMPGEFEHGGVSVRGIAAKRHIDPDGRRAVIYKVDIGGIRLAVLGHIDAPLDEKMLETIGVVDVLIVPIGGGGYTLDSKDAMETIRQVSPRIVIPTHFEDGVLYEVPQENFSAFEKEFSGVVEDKGLGFKIKSIEELPSGPVVYRLKRS